MKKYFIYDGQNQIGPFEKFELQERQIKAETPIWYDGLADWTTADRLPELSDLFVVKPPPFKGADNFLSNSQVKEEIRNPLISNTVPLQKENSNPKENSNKKNKLGKLNYGVIVSIVLVGIFLIFLYSNSKEKITDSENQVAIANASLTETQQNLEKQKEELKKSEDERHRVLAEQNSPEKLRENLISKETQSPTEYLKTVNETMQENITQQPDLFHHTKTDGYWVRGYIRNNATLATFKDIVIIVGYSTETNTHISDEVFTISKYLRPQSSIPFEHLCHPPQGFVNNWTCSVKEATPN